MFDLDKCKRVKGYISELECQALYDEALKVPEHGLIVELGCWLGRSTVAMAQAGRRIISVDTFQGNDTDCSKDEYKNTLAQWLENTKEYRDLCTPVVSLTKDYLLNCRAAIDFIFIDACHKEASVRSDFGLSLPLVRSGGRVALHDVSNYANPGPGIVWKDLVVSVLLDQKRVDMLGIGTKP
jgi:predicted O-methyltransferase YrrM